MLIPCTSEKITSALGMWIYTAKKTHKGTSDATLRIFLTFKEWDKTELLFFSVLFFVYI